MSARAPAPPHAASPGTAHASARAARGAQRGGVRPVPCGRAAHEGAQEGYQPYPAQRDSTQPVRRPLPPPRRCKACTAARTPLQCRTTFAYDFAGTGACWNEAKRLHRPPLHARPGGQQRAAAKPGVCFQPVGLPSAAPRLPARLCCCAAGPLAPATATLMPTPPPCLPMLPPLCRPGRLHVG